MKNYGFTLSDVRNVYSGPELELWELLMGEQIHVGGMNSSMELAREAGIEKGMKGVDLCCCLGGGMKFLARFFGAVMCGVDATERVIEEGRRRAEAEGFGDELEFTVGDVTRIPYPAGEFDFVWGEDAWCYVEDKARLIEEAARVLKPGGVIAFTDWIEAPAGLADDEAERICTFMKFPYMESFDGYLKLLADNGFEVRYHEMRTGWFADHVKLYIDMVSMQLTSDALKIIGFDSDMLKAIGGEMEFMRSAAAAGKMGQGRFVGVKK